MSSHICNHCNKSYTTKYSLIRHEKSINIPKQPKQTKEPKLKEIHKCKFCEKILTTKQRLLSHVDICKKNIRNSNIQDLTKKFEEITKEIEILKSNPVQQTITINTDNSTKNTLTNNTTHNYGSILSLTKEMIEEIFQKNYTMEDLFESQKGLADFTTKHFLLGKDKPLYLCTDKSRQRFVFTDKNQNETEDSNAFIIIKLMSKGFNKVDELYKEEMTILKRRLKRFIQDDNNTNIIETKHQLEQLENVYKKIKNVDKDGDVYRKQLSKLLPSSIENRKLCDQYLTSEDEDNQNEEDDNEENEEPESDEEDKQPENEPKYDKTARHIGGITYGGLRMYKNHYLKTGKKVYHPKHIGNPEFMKKFDEFCENDE